MSAGGTFDRTLEQRMAALARANEIRSGNALAKRQLKHGQVTLEEALGKDSCQSMRVFDLVLATPKVGRVKANKLLAALGISPSKRVGGLTDRQRDALTVWAQPYTQRAAA